MGNHSITTVVERLRARASTRCTQLLRVNPQALLDEENSENWEISSSEYDDTSEIDLETSDESNEIDEDDEDDAITCECSHCNKSGTYGTNYDNCEKICYFFLYNDWSWKDVIRKINNNKITLLITMNPVKIVVFSTVNDWLCSLINLINTFYRLFYHSSSSKIHLLTYKI